MLGGGGGGDDDDDDGGDDGGDDGARWQPAYVPPSSELSRDDNNEVNASRNPADSDADVALVLRTHVACQLRTSCRGCTIDMVRARRRRWRRVQCAVLQRVG